MLPWFIFGISLLVGVLFVLRWYVEAEPKALKKALKWAGLAAVVVVVAGLAASGKLVAAVVALPAILLWFARLVTGLSYARMASRLMGLGGAGRSWFRPGQGDSAGRTRGSDVRTRFVALHLDHASGHVTGEVLTGRFTGRRLEELGLDALLELLAEAGTDADSVRVLEGYLDRRDPDWRVRAKPGTDAGEHDSAVMTRQEALKILGLRDGAGARDIKAAHRRLMANVHPDHGGSDYLAQQINRARDVLLGK